ncbi:MAG: hypothetical protein IPN95_28800 [Bacteroidetes bacterium]|nr:hypothetical protein [Bacteroidota bacterium]
MILFRVFNAINFRGTRLGWVDEPNCDDVRKPGHPSRNSFPQRKQPETVAGRRFYGANSGIDSLHSHAAKLKNSSYLVVQYRESHYEAIDTFAAFGIADPADRHRQSVLSQNPAFEARRLAYNNAALAQFNSNAICVQAYEGCRSIRLR